MKKLQDIISELLIEISNISKVMASTEHPVVKQLLKL